MYIKKTGSNQNKLSGIMAAFLIAALLLPLAPRTAFADGADIYVTFYTMERYSVPNSDDSFDAPALFCRFKVEEGRVKNPGLPEFPEHYVAFIGWYTAPQGDPNAKLFAFSGVTEDTEVFAHFREDYLVSFLDGQGNVFLTKNVKSGFAVSVPTADEMIAFTEEQGKVLDGWESNSQTFDFAVGITGDTTLTPSFRANPAYYVFFYSEGTQAPFQSVPNNGRATEPETPIRAGYTFSGWREKDADADFSFSSMIITKDTTLYARWEGEIVNYTVMLWNEKDDIAADPGGDTSNYEYYNQYTKQDIQGYFSDAGLIDKPAGTEMTEGNFGDAIQAALAAAKSAANGKTPDKFNYLDTENYFISASTETLAGDGSTVVNVYLKRKTYTLKFDLSFSGGTMTIGDTTYVSGGDLYTVNAKMGQNVADVWPVRDPAEFNTVRGYNFQGWLAKGDEVTYSSRQLTLGSAIASTAEPDNTIALTAKWINSGNTVTVHYMFEQLPNETGGVKLGAKFYVESRKYTQTVFSPAMTAYNAKSIDGFAAVSGTAYKKNANGTYTLITGTPPKDQYLFYNRARSKLIFVGSDQSSQTNQYKVSLRPGLDYESIMYGVNLSGYEPTKPVKASNGEINYTFDGWYLDAGFLRKFDFNTASMPASDLPLFPKWKTSQFTVSVYDYIGAESPAASYGRANNERVGSPGAELGSPYNYETEVTYGGRTFRGWVTALGPGAYVPLSPDIPVTGDMNVYAYWTVSGITYTVTYTGVDGWPPPKDGARYFTGTDAVAKQPSQYSYDDKTFIGWTTTDPLSTPEYYPGQEIPIIGNVTLYPVFIAAEVPVTLKYNANFASYEISALPPDELVESHLEGDAVTFKDYYMAFGEYPQPGYIFAGWSEYPGPDEGPALRPGDKYPVTQDITMYAKYDIVKVIYLNDPDENEIYEDYQVRAETDIGGKYAVLSYEEVKSKADSWSVDTQYQFAGWYNTSKALASETQLHYPGAPDGRDKVIIDSGTVYLIALYIDTASDLIYHANLPDETPSEPTANYTYDNTTKVKVMDYGAIGDETDDTNVPLPTPSDTETLTYTFIGWNTRADGTGKYYRPGSDIIFVKESEHLYAQWTTETKYIVRFIPTIYAEEPQEIHFLVAAGGKVADSDGSVSNPSPDPDREDPLVIVKFIGWEKVGEDEQQQQIPIYNTDEAVNEPITEDTTFTALWAFEAAEHPSQRNNYPVVEPLYLEIEYDSNEHHTSLVEKDTNNVILGSEGNVTALLPYDGYLFSLVYLENDSDEWEIGVETRTDVYRATLNYMYAILGVDTSYNEIQSPVNFTIKPRALAPGASFHNIYTDDPGPVFDNAYYNVDGGGFSLYRVVDKDEAGFDRKGVVLYTPYKQGDPAGAYGIYARTGYYDVNGGFLGEIERDDDGSVIEKYLDGGNYKIDGADSEQVRYTYHSDRDFLITVNEAEYVKIGVFNVLKKGGGGGGTSTTKPPEYSLTPVPPAPEPGQAVFAAEHMKYIYGYPDGLVKPERGLTRAEASAVFFRLLSETYRSGVITRANAFPDVLADDWFNTEVSTLSEIGIVTGYPDGTFRPDAQITRAELASVAVRFAAIMRETGSIKVEFTDILGHWAEASIGEAARIGWVEGYPDNSFKPENFITRAEFVSIVNRMLQRAPESYDDLLPDTMKIWPDNTPDKWYYLDVQEASNGHEYSRKDKKVPNRDYNYEKWTLIITDTKDVPENEL
ncbi:MAG: InlB B-repeat-containing protein [Syntrophomonadaceae bacterium]|jgi:uncharacterized repeat protein (TIGR02543 family)|nr:InlB B-repeat-containing protein [Syntrophomonadaceae bacterium]